MSLSQNWPSQVNFIFQLVVTWMLMCRTQILMFALPKPPCGCCIDLRRGCFKRPQCTLVVIIFPGSHWWLGLWQYWMSAYRTNEWRSGHINKIYEFCLHSQSMLYFSSHRRMRVNVVRSASTSGPPSCKYTFTISIFIFFYPYLWKNIYL